MAAVELPTAIPTPLSSGNPQRLKRLATELGVPDAIQLPRLERPSAPVRYATPEHYSQVTALLAEQRRSRNEKFKEPSKKLLNRFKSQAKRERLDSADNWDFKIEERCTLLDRIVNENGDAGIVQALLEYKHDSLLRAPTDGAAVKVAKRLSRIDSSTVNPTTWLCTAVQHGNLQHVILLASHASADDSLSRAFEIASTSSSDISIVRELFRYGLDPNHHVEQLMLFIDDGNVAMVECFLQAHRPLQPVHVNTALARTVRRNDIQMMNMLLCRGADPNHAGGDAFLASIRGLKLDAVALLLTRSSKQTALRAEYLNHAVTIICENQHATARTLHAAFALLLSSGASPDNASLQNALYRSVVNGDLDLQTLLIDFGVAVDFGDAKCFRKSLSAGHVESFDALIRGRSSSSGLSKAVPTAMSLSDTSQRHHIMSLLLQKGAMGSEVADALTDSIRKSDTATFDQLIQHGVDGNYRGAAAYEAALQAQNVHFLKELCTKQKLQPNSAARILLMALGDPRIEEVRLELVAAACRGQESGLGQALLDEVSSPHPRTQMIALLLQNGAPVDFSNGAALSKAVLSGRTNILKLVLESQPSHLSLHAAFIAATSLKQPDSRLEIMSLLLQQAGGQKIGQDDALVQETIGTANLKIINLLLQHGAAVDYRDGEALINAVRSASLAVVQLLLSHQSSAQTLSNALEEGMRLPRQSRLDIVNSIATAALRQQTALPLTIHLPTAVREADTELAKMLLQYGADPNQEDGQVFLDAARLPDLSILRALLLQGPDIKKLLPGLIRTLDDERHLVECLKLCFDELQIQLNANENVLLFLAIDKFHQGEQLVRFLLDAGCSTGVTRLLQLHVGDEVEDTTPLIWALSRPMPGPSHGVIMAILDTGDQAKPNFITSYSKTTALLEASKSGRYGVVTKLIAIGAKTSLQDSEGRSALLLACESGNLQLVQALLTAKVRPNDGSLHAAAREAHADIVLLLLNNGHAADHIYAGRSALAELCRNGHGNDAEWEDRAYKTIETLINYGCATDGRYAGKNLVHLALDNDMPVGVLDVLLSFPQFSSNLNSDSFIYEDGTGTIYSPLSYLETFHTGPPTEKAKLTKLLEDKNCNRNLWNRQGRHPPNFTYNTLPPHLKARIDQERLDELQHAQGLKRRQEQARIDRDLADAQHAHLLQQAAHRDSAAATALAHRHTLEKRHAADLASQEAATLRMRHQSELAQQSALATQRQQIEDRDRQRAYAHQREMNALEMQRVEGQKQLVWEQERAGAAAQARQVQLLERQDVSVRARAAEMRGVAEAAGRANMGNGNGAGQQKQIGFGNSWATVD